MQTVEELPGKLGIRRTIAMHQIRLVADELDLVEQFLGCLSCEQNLVLTKVN